MPRETVLKLSQPDEQYKVDFVVVTKGKIYDCPDEVVEPNDSGLGDSLARAWNWRRFIVTDEFGRRTYCVPGDIAPSRKQHELGWGFALDVETSLDEGVLSFVRTEPGIQLEPITIGRDWKIGNFILNKVSEVVVISPRYLDTTHLNDAPSVDNTSLEVLEAELTKADFGSSLHTIARTILNTHIEF